MKCDFHQLRSLLRKPVDDAAVLEFIGGDPAVVERDEYYGSVVFKDAGLELVLKEAAHVLRESEVTDPKRLYVCAVHLHRGGHEGFNQYAGELPGAVSFGDSETKVRQKLGAPSTVGGGGAVSMWTKYRLGPTDELHLRFDGSGRLQLATVRSIPAEDDPRHTQLTAMRAGEYGSLFGGPPSSIFSHDVLHRTSDQRFLIDVFVYPQIVEGRTIEVAVTNGMSDRRMVDRGGNREPQGRRELIQYFPKCTEGHARRLHNMAWLPLFDGFVLDECHSLAWDSAAVEGTPWTSAFFLPPIVKHHREFVCEVEGDPATLLWHIPISDEELAYKVEHGADSLIRRMEAVGLPWIFDELNRPPLL
jgi:hypothetical protein